MFRFPSEEWAMALQQALNTNSEYAESALAWEGDILLLVAPDAAAPSGEGIYLDLYHGTCRSAKFMPAGTGVEAEFVYVGSRDDWRRLLRHEIDPVRAALDGTFRLRGNLAKAMRFTRAAKAMIESAATVPTEP